MTRFAFAVPPTPEIGSYRGICRASVEETYRKNALYEYNHARMHDGLPPLSRMPRGTRYARKVLA